MVIATSPEKVEWLEKVKLRPPAKVIVHFRSIHVNMLREIDRQLSPLKPKAALWCLPQKSFQGSNIEEGEDDAPKSSSTKAKKKRKKKNYPKKPIFVYEHSELRYLSAAVGTIKLQPTSGCPGANETL